MARKDMTEPDIVSTALARNRLGVPLYDPATGTITLDEAREFLTQRRGLPLGFDLPGFYRRAGLLVLGPFLPGEPRARRLPPLAPYSCVALCRAVLGGNAPFAMTPLGLFRSLNKMLGTRKNVLTSASAAE